MSLNLPQFPSLPPLPPGVTTLPGRVPNSFSPPVPDFPLPSPPAPSVPDFPLPSAPDFNNLPFDPDPPKLPPSGPIQYELFDKDKPFQQLLDEIYTQITGKTYDRNHPPTDVNVPKPPPVSPWDVRPDSDDNGDISPFPKPSPSNPFNDYYNTFPRKPSQNLPYWPKAPSSPDKVLPGYPAPWDRPAPMPSMPGNPVPMPYRPGNPAPMPEIPGNPVPMPTSPNVHLPFGRPEPPAPFTPEEMEAIRKILRRESPGSFYNLDLL